MHFIGRGIHELRLTQAATAALALTGGMSAVVLATGSWAGATLTSVALAAWMYPRHKVIETFMALTAVLAATLMTAFPDPRHYAIAGFLAGFAFFFGLNHGLYATGGLAVLLSLMILKGYGLAASHAMLSFSMGLGLALVITLGFIFLVPGMLGAYWRRKVLRILQRGTANLALQIPWLGRALPPQFAGNSTGVICVVRICFTFLPIVAAAGLLGYMILHRQLSPHEWAIAGTASVAAFYFHHALSRADFAHLAQAMPPFIVAMSLWCLQFDYGWLAVLGLALASLRWAYWPFQVEPRRGPLEAVETPGGRLMLDAASAQQVNEARRIVNAYSVPVLVTLYPLLDRRPAVYDIFCVYPATREEQEAMIKELSATRPPLALIWNVPVDSREDLRFSRTHPLVWSYLHESMKPLQCSAIYDVFVREGSSDDRE
jgi:hypothetical protein